MLLHLALPGWLKGYTPAEPDPLSELHRWKAQPELDMETLYVGDADNNGVIWLASDDGLYAYDGRAVSDFTFPDEWPDLGPAKDILCSQSGYHYVLYQKGLISFHPSGGFDITLSVEESGEKSTSLTETADGSVWLGIRHGLFRIEEGNPEAVDCGFDSIRAVEVDAEGDLWIANDENKIGIFRPEPSKAPSLELVEQVSLSPELYGLHSHLYRKPDGTMWILLTRPSWAVVEFSTDRTTRVIPVPDGFESSIGFNYCPMPDGRIIFTEKSTTAQFYNGEWIRLSLEQYPVATHESFAISLPENRLLLGGSHTQRYLIDLSDERWMTYLDLIFCDQDTEGKEWFIHKNRDVLVHDPDTETWSRLTESDGLIDSPNAILGGSDGTVWVSGMHENNAAFSYLRNGEWHRHSFPGIGYTFGHLAVCELPDGSLIFGNGSDGYFDTRPGGAVVCRPTPSGVDMQVMGRPYYPERLYCVSARGDQGLWIGGRNLHFKSGPESRDLILNERFQRSWIDHMIVDHKGALWVANWRLGLFQLDEQNWQEIRAEDGNASIQATFILQRSGDHSIWVGNTEGLHRYDGRTWSHGILAEDFRFPKEGANMVEGKDDDLWLNFSCRDWLLNSPIRQDNRPHAHRTIRYREEQQAPETEFTRLEDELNEPANAFFSWTGMDRWEDTARKDLEYSYRLSGRDWTPFTKRTETALLDLAAGDYTIEVKSRDQNFNVDPSPVVASFRVIPPLWKQAWFLVVLAGVVATAIMLVAIIIRQRITHAVALSEFKVDFFAKLSHELRTPLSVILGPLDRLMDRCRSTEDRKALEMIQRNATKLLGLVNQLLEFRKVELGKMECHPSTGEIVGFVNDILYSLSPLWEQKKQKVEITLDEGPFSCAFDPDIVLRICDNLLANAIKYTPEGGEISVRVHVLQAPGKADILDLRIADTGVGIPKSRLGHITEPFYMAGNKELEKTGSGLGLALVKEMVDLCEGTIKIESETDGNQKGTRIHVSLPLFPAKTKLEPATDDSGVDEADPDDNATAPSEIHEKQKRLLVVEDNPDLRLFLRTELSRHFKVDTAENGLLGIKLALEIHPDLILSDVMMPEMDGIELCRKIRETPEISHIPIILLTARTGETHYLEGIESGADEYFSKPVSVPKLVARIENLLQSRQKLHKLFADQVVLEPREIAVLPADQLFLRNAIDIAEENMQTEGFDVDAFAKQMAVSRATLNRKIKAITGTSPKAFIRSMRIKRAAQLLASSDLPINEIFFQVGFYDASNFSRVFKKETGMTPSQYRDSHPHQDRVNNPESAPRQA